MEDPPSEIPRIIHLLTQSPPALQRAILEKYFTPNASFTHPFCRTGSFEGSRWLIWCIYRWYKIMSPRIEIEVDSVGYDASAYDPRVLTLYVSIRQLFSIWAIPFFSANVSLVTVLQLVKAPPYETDPKSKSTYLIQSQNDLYQVNEFVKFGSQFGILSVSLMAWQLFATGLCVLGVFAFWPVTWVEQNMLGGNQERSFMEVVKG